ncbi:MAG: hypothetical protein RLZZ324_515 [Candidatus Parcubacteria bacterium]|jgi:hypothetical protein
MRLHLDDRHMLSAFVIAAAVATAMVCVTYELMLHIVPLLPSGGAAQTAKDADFMARLIACCLSVALPVLYAIIYHDNYPNEASVAAGTAGSLSCVFATFLAVGQAVHSGGMECVALALGVAAALIMIRNKADDGVVFAAAIVTALEVGIALLVIR